VESDPADVFGCGVLRGWVCYIASSIRKALGSQISNPKCRQ